MKYPNLFILGAPKCGTTTIVDWLSQHPNVYFSKVKEPHYYAEDLYPDMFASSHRSYLSLFQNASTEHKFLGEASTGYLFSRVAVDKIIKSSPKGKFVVCLRNPITMAPSLHRQRVNDGLEDVDDFEKAWQLQEKRVCGEVSIPFACPNPLLLNYGGFCRLGHQVSILLEKIPRHQVKFLILDDMIKNPEREYKELIEFLGLEWLPLDSYKATNTAFERKYKTLHNLLAKAYYVRRKLRIPRLGTGLMAIESKLNRRPVKSSKPDREVTKMLVNFFHEDIKLLERKLGRDFSFWLSTE